MNDMMAWASILERYGRNGDTMLAHITPAEAKHLKRRGGSGTVNPVTGLPEFWGGGETSDSPGSAGGGNGDNGVSDPGGFGGNTDFGWGNDSFSGGVGMGIGDSESSIGGAGGDGNSYADQSIGGTMGLGGRGMMVSPEMGGHVGRQRGQAAVAALGEYGRNVNRASSVMSGQTPGFGDRMADAFGIGAPGGFGKSSAAALGAGLLGGVVAGPLGAMAGYHGYNAGVRGAPVGRSIGGFLGGAVGGGLGALAGSAIGGMFDGGSKTSAGATVGTGSAPPGVGGGYHSVSDPTAHTDSADYGARAGVEYQMQAPEKPPEATPSTGSVPKDWDELGFLERNPEVKAAVENGTWKSGYAFNAAYQASAGVPYESAMTTDRNQEWLSTKPGQAVPYRGTR